MILGALSRAASRLTGTVLRLIVPLAAALTLAVAAAPAAADTTSPTIASVTLSSTPSFDADGDSTADTYIRGDRIVVDVRFSEAVTVSGGNNGVRLRLDLGADDTNLANSRKVLKLKSVVGGDTLRFEHRVARRNSDPDGVWVQTASATNARAVFTVGGATVTSTATGVAAVLTKSGLPTTGAANHRVDGSRTQAPVAANRAPAFPANAPTTFEVAEHNARGASVGTVAATDPDGDALTYSLDSASDAAFDIDSSGNITVTAANTLDHETKASYAVTVSVHDGKDAASGPDSTVDATHSVTIRVTPEPNRAPVVNRNAQNYYRFTGTNNAPRGVLVSKGFHGIFSDPDGDNLTYAMSFPADQAHLVDIAQITDDGRTDALVAQSSRPPNHIKRVWFRAEAEADWKALTPPLWDRPVVTVTVTATDPDGLSASVDGPFLIGWESYPEVVSARANREVIELTFDWPVEDTPAPAPAQFTVNVVNGDGSEGTIAVSGVSVSEKVVTLELASAQEEGQTVTVDYAHDYRTPLQLAGGGDPAPSFDGLAVEVRGSSRSRTQAATNRAPTFPATAPTTLEVAENNARGAPVGTVAATDPDGDALTYALDSASDAVFDIDSSGTITVTAANALDYETTASYSVTVSVHDGKDAAGAADTTVDATHALTIAVTDVEESTSANRAPTFLATVPTTLEVAENNARGAPVGTVAATDPDGDALIYALDSASNAVFDIDSSGAITVKWANALDHEKKASYPITVSVHDGKDAFGQPDTAVDATHSLTVAVTDVRVEAVRYTYLIPSSVTSTKLAWILPTQPASVTASAVEVQVMPRGTPPWRTVASLPPVADTDGAVHDLIQLPAGTKLMVHEVIGLTPGEWYHIRIRLVTNSGNADSESIVMIKAGLPKPVTDLSVSNVTRTAADLSWTLPPVEPASPRERELKVQQRGANGDWTTVATLDPVYPTDGGLYDRIPIVPTSYTVTGLTAGTSYTFRIRNVTGTGNADSQTVSTTTLGGSLNPAGGLTASNPTRTTIDLAWALPTQPAGVTVTGLEVQQQSAGSWTAVASLDATATSHTLTGLTEGTTYTFRVRLAANNGTVDSETVSATALASPKPATGLAASNQSRTGIDLSWTLPAQSLGVTVSAVEVQYRYARSKGLGFNDWEWGTVATLASDATSHTVTQVTPGTNYAFRIRLATNNGHADSESVTAAALEPPKPATGLSFSNVTGTTVDLSWSLPAQPEGVIVTAVEVHSGGLVKPGDENHRDFSLYGHVELAGDATTITWSAIHGGFTQNFRVRLITNSGDVDSEIASWSSTRPYPKSATDLTASNATQTTVDLAWTLPEQPGVTVSAVEVVWDLADGTYRYPWNTETLAADAASHTVTGLRAGTAYSFFVRLVTSSGNPSSDILSMTTPSGTESTPAVSVADASANEGADAAVEFVVSLSRAASGTVTVDYATENGTARAGEDYTAVSGTLTFAAGEREKTVSVPILDDALDEGTETFTLKLQNAQGAWISDAEATGTITNSDPLQKMWLSRFGRTVASHVTDAVSDRLSGPLTGKQVTLGGQTVELAATVDEPWPGEAMTSVARALGASEDPEPVGGAWPELHADGWESPALARSPVPTVSGRELLLGSAFHLATEGDGTGPGLVAWGRVTAGRFDGAAPADTSHVRIGGEVTTGILGADAEWNWLLAGVAVSVSQGKGSFDQPGVDKGKIESTMTTVSPYARFMVNDRLSVWGLAGWGTGDMTIVQDARDAADGKPARPELNSRTDIGMRLAALGGRGALMQADESGGIDFALKADAFHVETESEPISNEGKTVGKASRVRLALEGSRAFRVGNGTLTPGLELGLRHDGGDAETGAGVELGGRVSWTDLVSGLSVEAMVRTLVAHEDSDYEEWGASGMIRFDPGVSGQGLSFSLAPTYGAAASGVDRLWAARDAGGLAPDGEAAPERRLVGELGYGLALPGGFTGTPNVGFGLSSTARDWRVGWRLKPAVPGAGISLDLDATRREVAVDAAWAPEHELMLRGALHW